MLVALGLLAAGLGLAARQWRSAAGPGTPAPAGVRDSTSTPRAAEVDERAIKQALKLTPGFEPDKHRWMDEVRGADVSALTPPQRELFVAWANAERCTCGCGYTLAGCRAYDATCDVSRPRVEALLDSVRQGLVTRAPAARKRRFHGG